MPAFSLHKKFSILYVYTKTPENPEILKRKELKKWKKTTDNGYSFICRSKKRKRTLHLMSGASPESKR